MKLTEAGLAKIKGLQVPFNGTGFAVKVKGEEIL